MNNQGRSATIEVTVKAAETWTAGSVGTHGSKADDIVSKLSELLDKFLTNYLRVNEAACTESPQPPTQ